ncbi:PE family protein PE31 [Mycobacterium tuberculosis M2828]|nr:PE family protein PE31 [Mycobacterium tuberculosis M2828]
MSFTAQPEMLAAAAGELRSLGATLKASNAAAAVPTTGVVPPAADEVSLLLATQFRRMRRRIRRPAPRPR